MKRLNTFLVAASLLLIGTKSYAESPSFTYVGAEYVADGTLSASVGSLSAELDSSGFALNASVELGIFVLQASRLELDNDDIFIIESDSSITSAAVGLTFELPQTQIYGLVRAQQAELAVSGGGFSDSFDETIAGVEVGARVNLTDRFEINANIGSPAGDSGLSYGVGGQFFVTDNIGITLNFNTIEADEDGIEAEFETSAIGVRFTF